MVVPFPFLGHRPTTIPAIAAHLLQMLPRLIHTVQYFV
jgi:hypothetical protein